MSDIPEQYYGKVASDMNPFEKILSKVPGFGGYMERQNRRDSDKLLREHLANEFEALYHRVSGLQRDFISQGEIAFVDDLEASTVKLRTFADRVRRASRGYSGLFDAVMINEDELGRLYAYDASMLDLTGEVARAIDNVESSVGSDGLPAAIRNLNNVSQQAIDVYNQRQEAIFSPPEAPSSSGTNETPPAGQ